MIGFKLYDVPGVSEPLRLSPEHAEELGATEVSEPDPHRPARNASQAAWAEYAKGQGMDPDAAEAASRNELRDLYG